MADDLAPSADILPQDTGMSEAVESAAAEEEEAAPVATPCPERKESPVAGGPGFGLSFIEGRALIGFSTRDLTDWLRAKDLCLEVPNIRFPFDVTAGAETFRNRRCRLVGLSFEADEAGATGYLLHHLRPLFSGETSPLRDIEIRFAQGFVEVAGTIAAGALDETGGDFSRAGATAPFSLKIAVDASAGNEVRLLVHDARLYSPSTLPAPAVAVAFLSAVERSGLPVEVELPSVVRFDPVSPYLRGLLPRQGWKLPDARHARLSSATIEPGRAGFVFDAGKTDHPAPDTVRMRGFLSALEGSLAFAQAEEALAEARYRDARTAWLVAAGPLPDHPFAAERLLALLLADPTTIDDAFDLAQALLERDRSFLPALLTRALVRVSRDERGAAADLLEVSRRASESGEVLGALQAALVAGRLAETESGKADAAGRHDQAAEARALAAQSFERVLDERPADREAILALARILPRLGDLSATERILKRRLSIAVSDEELADVHLALGRLHIGVPSSLGDPPPPVAEGPGSADLRAPFLPDPTRAKLHLDAALRHDPLLADAWTSLGRACARAQDPLRAVRCLDRGRDLLVSEGRIQEAAEASREVALLWECDLSHPENAILRYQQVLELFPKDIEARLRHAELSFSLGHVAEAEAGFESVLESMAREAAKTGQGAPATLGEGSNQAGAALLAHLALADIARRHYQADAVALGHLERALKLSSEAGREEQAQGILADIVAVCETIGDSEKLASACDRAAAAVPDPVEKAGYLSRAARLYLALGETALSRERAALARALDPDGLEPRLARVAVEAACGSGEDYAAALDDLARNTDDPTLRAPHLLELGRLRLQVLEMTEASLSPLAQAREEAAEESLRKEAAELHLEAARRLGRPEAMAESLQALSAVQGQDVWRKTAALLEAALIHEEQLGDAAGAMRLLSDLRLLDSEDPRPAWHLGRLLLASGEPRSAWSVFLEMNALGGPEAAGVPIRAAYPLMGEAALLAGDQESAARYLAPALRQDPADEALESMALSLMEELGRHQEAAALLRACAAAHTELDDRFGAADRYRKAAKISEEILHDVDAAAQSLDDALAVAFSDEEARAALASPVEWSERHHQALAAAGDRLRLATELGDAAARADARFRLAGLALEPAAAAEHLSRRGEDLLEIGDLDQAVAGLELALGLYPRRLDIRERLAGLLDTERPEDALAQLEWLIDAGSKPDVVESGEAPTFERTLDWRLDAADAAVRAGLPDRARHHLGIHVAHRPGDAAVCAKLADLLRASNDYEELHAVLVHLGENLLSRPDLEGEPLLRGAETMLEAAAIAVERLGRQDLGRAALEFILDRDPDHVPALEALLPLLDPTDWTEMRAEVLGRLARREDCPRTRAELLCDQGDCLLVLAPGEAEEAYRRALADDPASTRAADGLAAVAWERQDLFAFAGACSTRAKLSAQALTEDAGIRLLVAARLHLDLLGDTRAGLVALDLAMCEGIRPALAKEELGEVLRRRLGCHLAMGDAQGALQDLTELIQLAKSQTRPETRAALHRRRAGLREATGDITGAREDWGEGHRLDRSDPIALERLMSFAENDGDIRALAHLHAIQAAQALGRGHRDTAARALAERARLLAGPLENPGEALLDLERAASLGVDGALRASLLQSLRESLLALGRFEEAVKVALREASLLVDHEAARHLLEMAQLATGAERADLGLACVRAAFRRAPDDLLVATSLLERLFMAGAVEECIPLARVISSFDPVELARALDLGERDAEERLRIAAFVLLESDPEAAFPVLDRLCESKPGDAHLSDALVALCLSRGETERAMRALSSRMEAAPHRHRPILARRLAEIAAASEDAAQEARWLREAFRLEDAPPSEAEAERLLSAILRSKDTQGYVIEARRYLDTLSRVDPARASKELALHSTLLIEHGAPGESLELLSFFDDLRGDSIELLQICLKAAEAENATDLVIEARDNLVQLLVEEGEDQAAAEHLLALGELHQAGGDLESAGSAFQEALLRGTRAPGVLERALFIAKERGDAGCEADLLEMAIDSASDEETIAGHLISLARLFAGSLDAPARAEAALRAALEHLPGHEAALEDLTALLLAQARHGELAALVRGRAEVATGEQAALFYISAARYHQAAMRPSEAVADLMNAKRTEPVSFAREGGETLLDDARAAAGMHLERAQARLCSPPGPGLWAKCLEAGDILRDEAEDVQAAARAYRLAYDAGGGQRAAQRLRDMLAELGDNRGLGELARDEANQAPPGPARLALLRSAGDLFESAGEEDAAIEMWRTALFETPGDGAVLERLRRTLEAAGRHAELAEITRLLAEGSAGNERARALVEAARLHRTAKDPASALSCLEEAEAADPEHDEATRLLAEALWDVGRRGDAVSRYLRILPREALGNRSHERVSEHLEAEGRLRELAEVTTARAATARTSGEERLAVDLYLRAVRLWMRAGEPSATRAAAFGAFHLDPGDEEAFEATMRCVVDEGDPCWTVEVLEAHVDALPAEGPRRLEQLQRLIEARLAAGDPAGARADLDALVATGGHEARIVSWALALVRAGNWPDAADRVVRLASRLVDLAAIGSPFESSALMDAHRTLATAAIEEGNLKAGLRHLRSALPLAGSRAEELELTERLAQSALAADLHGEAAKAFVRLADLRSDEEQRLEAILRAADAFERDDDPGAAKEAWRRVFDLDPASERAYAALFQVASGAQDKLCLLQTHAEATAEPERRRDLLLELAALAAEMEDTGLADRCRLEAWRLFPNDLRSAAEALTALRNIKGGRGSIDLASALQVVASESQPQAALPMLAEAAGALEQAGDLQGAADLALETIIACQAASSDTRIEDGDLARMAEALGDLVEVAERRTEEASEKARINRLAASCSRGGGRVSYLIVAAEHSQAAGDTDRARHDLEAALEISPPDDRVPSRLIAVHLSAGDLDQAAGLARSLVARPGATADLLLVADAAERAGRADLVADLLTLAVRLDKKNPAWCARLVDARLAIGDSAGAAAAAALHLERLDHGEVEAGEIVAATALTARLHAKTGQDLIASTFWEETLDRDPAHAEALAALEAWHRSRKSWPELVQLHSLRGEKLAAQGKIEAAAAAAIAASDAARGGGDLEQAMAALETALARRPGCKEARARLLSLAELASSDGDDELTTRVHQTAMETAAEPEAKAAAALVLARHHRSASRSSEAAEAYTEALTWAGGLSRDDPSVGLPGEILREAGIYLAGAVLAENDAASAHDFMRLARSAGAAGRDVRHLEARVAEAAGELAAAMGAWRSLAEEDPEDQIALENLVRLAITLEDPDTEIWTLSRMAENTGGGPGAGDLWLTLGARAESLCRDEEATAAYRRALELEPANRVFFESLKRRLESADDTDALLRLWRTWARKVDDDPSKAEAFFEEARLARERAGDFERAAEAFERCLAVAPNREDALAGLAHTLHEMGAHQRAETLLRTIPEGNSELPAFLVHYRLGKYAAEEERHAEALASFKNAAERNPAFIDAWEDGLRAARALGAVDAEMELLLGLLEASPDMGKAMRVLRLCELATAQRKQGDLDAAAASYSAALAVRPDDRKLLGTLLGLNRERRRFGEVATALSSLAGLTEEGQERAGYLIELADLCVSHLDDPHGADIALRSAVATDPDNVEAWRRVLSRAVAAADSAEIARAARKLAGLGNEEALGRWPLEIGRALVSSGDTGLAAPLLEAASFSRPGDRIVASEAATALIRSGNTRMAVAVLDFLAASTGAPMDQRAAAEAALCDGDERGFAERMVLGIDDPDLVFEERSQATVGIAARLSRLGDVGAAIDLLHKMAAERPSARDLRHELAARLLEAERRHEAHEVYLDLARSDPSDIEAVSKLSELLESEDPDRAALAFHLVTFLRGRTSDPDRVRLPPPDLSALHIDQEARGDLSDPVAAAPMARFLRAMAPALEPLFPADLHRWGVTSADLLLPTSDPVAQRALAWGLVVGAPAFNLYRSERLGFEVGIENTRPAAIVVGAAVMDGPQDELDQILCRAVDLLAAGYALPGKFADRDVAVLMRLALSFFHSEVDVSIPADKLAAYHEAMKRLLPEEQQEALCPLAAQALAALPRFDPASLAPALRRTSDRVTLLCSGDLPATLEATLRLDRRSAGGETDRVRAVRSEPALFDLCRFALREDVGDLWRRLRPEPESR